MVQPVHAQFTTHACYSRFSLYVPGMRRVADSLISTMIRVNDPGFRSRKKQETSLFLKTSKPTQQLNKPPIQWATEEGILSSGVKRPGRKAGQSPLSSSEGKKNWVELYLCTPCVFITCIGKALPLRSQKYSSVLAQGTTDIKTSVRSELTGKYFFSSG
jgi:hypothetical protein